MPKTNTARTRLSLADQAVQHATEEVGVSDKQKFSEACHQFLLQQRADEEDYVELSCMLTAPC